MIMNILLGLLLGALLILAGLCSGQLEAAEPEFPWADIQPREGMTPHPSVLTMILAVDAMDDWKDSPPTLMGGPDGQPLITVPHMIVNLMCSGGTQMGTLAAFSKAQAFAIIRMYLAAMEKDPFVAMFEDTPFQDKAAEVWDVCHGSGWYPKGKGGKPSAPLRPA